MKKIGKGAFTTAYLQPDGKVLLKSVDPVKEAMANGFFPEHRLFPVIEQVDQGAKFKYYTMKYFPKVKSLKSALTPRQYKLYNILRNLPSVGCYPKHQYYRGLLEMFAQIPSEFRNERNAIMDAVHGLSNYSKDICFEISPRNVAVSGGKLILLDCFFMMSALCKTRSR